MQVLRDLKALKEKGDRLRVAIGLLMQETNTFVPQRTNLETFRAVYLREGDELLSGFATARTEIPAFIDVLRSVEAEIVPLIAANAIANGTVTRAAFDDLMARMVGRLTGAGPVDGVLLALHGAMVVEDNPDAESEIVARVAEVLPPGTPIGVSFDLHGHVTPQAIQPDVFYVGYQEYPHIDMYETGERTARLLLETLARRRRPVMAFAKRPLIVSPVKARTVDEPLASIVREARRMEATGEVLHASLFPVQPWLDVPDLGFGVLVCADGDVARAQQAADRLADMAWDRRDQFEPDLTALTEAIRIGLISAGTTVVADAGDAPTGGSAADSTAVLAALLAAGADSAGRLSYLTLRDAAGASRAIAAGVGAEVNLAVGHAHSVADGKPVAIRARVLSVSDGRYQMRDAGARGMVMEQGPTAVLAIGDIRLVLRSRPAYEWDTGIYEAFGLSIRDAALAFVKSPSHFRVGFEPLAARVLTADTPGPTCPNMRRLNFSRVTRPLYPLDEFTLKGRP